MVTLTSRLVSTNFGTCSRQCSLYNVIPIPLHMSTFRRADTLSCLFTYCSSANNGACWYDVFHCFIKLFTQSAFAICSVCNIYIYIYIYIYMYYQCHCWVSRTCVFIYYEGLWQQTEGLLQCKSLILNLTTSANNSKVQNLSFPFITVLYSLLYTALSFSLFFFPHLQCIFYKICLDYSVLSSNYSQPPSYTPPLHL